MNKRKKKKQYTMKLKKEYKFFKKHVWKFKRTNKAKRYSFKVWKQMYEKIVRARNIAAIFGMSALLPNAVQMAVKNEQRRRIMALRAKYVKGGDNNV